MTLDDAETGSATSAIWIVLLSTATVLFSFAFACATPFAALAAVAGTRMRRGDALAAVTLAWLGNQAIGFLLLHYPTSPSTFAWGAAIGVAALAATLAASGLRRLPMRAVATTVLALGVAFVVYEGVLLATAGIMGSGFHAFAPAIVARIAAVDAVALAALLILFEAVGRLLSLAGPRGGATNPLAR